MLTYGSLFAGAGGADLGFHAAGLNCRWQVEIDRRCRSVLARQWPDAQRFADVREVGSACLEPVDVIVGGFPCQDLSVAGRRKGLSGERSSLFYELARVCTELRPRFLVWENVPGLLSSDDGRDFGRVLRHLGDCGYFGAWRVLDAEGFGVAQTRRRVFGAFAPGRAGAERGGQILALAESLSRHSAPGREAGAEVARTLGSGPKGSGFRVDFERSGAFIPTVAHTLRGEGHDAGEDGSGRGAPLVAFTERGEGHATFQEASVSGSLRAGGGGAVTANLVAFGGNDGRGERRADSSLSAKGGSGRFDYETETFVVAQCHGSNVGEAGTLRRGNGNVTGGVPFVAFSCKDDGGDAGEVAPTLRAMGHAGGHANAGGQVAVAFNWQSGGDGRTGLSESTAPAIQASQTPAVLTKYGVRRLTPRECERVMGWPDDHTRYGADGKEIPDGPRYRMIGNGVAAPVAEWIGRRLIELEG